MSRKSKPKRHWEEVAREAQEYRDASLGRVPGISDIARRLPSLELLQKSSINEPSKVLEPKDIQITELLPEDLAGMLGRGDINAVEVTTAFLRRAALAQRFVSLPSQSSKLFTISSVPIISDKLHHRAPPRKIARSSQRTRSLLPTAQEARWTSPWPSN